MYESIMTHPTDHIMANTWRLILERQNRSTAVRLKAQPLADFLTFEEILTEYRLIGLSLVDTPVFRRPS